MDVHPKKNRLKKGFGKGTKIHKMMEKSFGVLLGTRKHGGSNAKVKLPTVGLPWLWRKETGPGVVLRCRVIIQSRNKTSSYSGPGDQWNLAVAMAFVKAKQRFKEISKN